MMMKDSMRLLKRLRRKEGLHPTQQDSTLPHPHHCSYEFCWELPQHHRKSVNPRMDESVRRIQKKLREKVYQRSYMLRRTFRALDEEHAGTISLEKFEDAIMKNFNLGEDDREALHKFVELIDADHSGSIDYDEFATHLKQNDGVVAEDVEQWEKLRFQRPGLGFMGMKKLVDELPLSYVVDDSPQFQS
jgi:hypothetical protein